MGLVYTLVGVAVFLLFFVVVTNNKMVVLRERVLNAWSQVDVQLKRRYDLIPNLVETVKGYAAHERETLQKVTEARTRAMAAGSISEQAGAETMLSGALKTLFAVVENYPQLKADGSFQKLQDELANTEGKIAFARQFYNDIVQRYNTRLRLFPTNIVASRLGFKPADYFAVASGEEREAVKVSFNK